ncbi:DUF1835 domain-containing protein [Salinimicrobium sp. GXAS 041]|uniref:DUF1835 domain-containing protein n=1 Tax=Salinimicrobium sp. GXAS 041 TaxID=3400806 RepID=UPI003C733204
MEEKKLLHITNGDDLTDKLQELHIPGDVIVWREMLCEGPTVQEVGNEDFLKIRKNFLWENYKISKKEYQEKFIDELDKLAAINGYDEVILWFEFDLFSHMNMLAVISFLKQKRKNNPLYLVCSGRLKGDHELAPLSELSIKQLQRHYDCKIHLTEDDLHMAELIWDLYCSKNPKRLKAKIKKTSNFEYLSSCIRAHIERFPNVKSGLNSLEINVLKLIQNHQIISLHHLLGYALKYQGYYGYGDIQMQRVIEKLNPFYAENGSEVKLNEAGLQAISASKNYYQDLKDNDHYGGVAKYDFLYDPDSHNLLKL